MKERKYEAAAKSAGEAFSIAASIAGMIFDIVGAAFKIPNAWSWIKWAGSALVGLVSACFSARKALKKGEEELVPAKDKDDSSLNSSASMVFSTLRNSSPGVTDDKDEKSLSDKDKDYILRITREELLKLKDLRGKNDRFFSGAKDSMLHHRSRSDQLVPSMLQHRKMRM